MLHFSAYSYLICAVLLFLRRKQGDTSRIMLAVSFLIWSALMLGNLIYHYNDPRNLSQEVLSMTSLQIMIFAFFAMLLYPLEVIESGRVTVKNMLILSLPNVIIFVLILLTRPDFRRLASFGEIFQYIGAYNVWLRLAIVVWMIPLTFTILYIPYIHTRSRVNLQWIRWFCTGMFISTSIYIIWVLTGSVVVKLLMQTYCLIFCLIITYQELYIRLPAAPHQEPLPLEGKPRIEATEIARMSPLWKRLIKLVTEQSVWHNPDLTLVELASMVGTNRTTLSNLIREAGYDGFYAFINTCRIKEFIHIVQSQEVTSIHETFFDVGFRSKATALRYFRQETGTTPSEYLQKVLLRNK